MCFLDEKTATVRPPRLNDLALKLSIGRGGAIMWVEKSEIAERSCFREPPSLERWVLQNTGTNDLVF